jgi:hypothetical protein
VIDAPFNLSTAALTTACLSTGVICKLLKDDVDYRPYLLNIINVFTNLAKD